VILATASEAAALPKAFLSLSGVLRGVPLGSGVKIHGVGVLSGSGRVIGQRASRGPIGLPRLQALEIVIMPVDQVRAVSELCWEDNSHQGSF
jgi:hypothetical protein